MKLKFFLLVIISLFLFSLSPAQDPPLDLQPAKGYLLGPGDEIIGKVLGEPQFDFVATVNEDGKIEVPFFEKPIVAKCRTERELRADVSGLLTKYLRTPQLSLQVSKRNSRPPVTIYGEVYSPKEITLTRRATLVDLLALTGGPKEEAGGMIQIFRTQPPFCPTDGENGNWRSDSPDPTDVPSRMYSLASVKLGKEEANPVIYPGDLIFVHKAAPIYITGEVVAPQGIYLKEGGLSLSEAIAMVSGVRREAKTKDIKIYRLKEKSKERTVISANYDLIKQGKQADVMLEAYDIVEVDKSRDSIAMSILKIAIGSAKQGISAVATSGGYRVLY